MKKRAGGNFGGAGGILPGGVERDRGEARARRACS